MLDVPLALAFAAGLVATVNPCGFAMLPAYLSFFVSVDSGAQPSAAEAVGRGVRVGLVVSAGFLVVFGLAGMLLSAGAQALVDVMPWIALVVGAGLVGLGGWLLAGRSLPIRISGPKTAVKGRGSPALLGFGIAYALASLSCTLPVFLTVIAGTMTRTSLPGALAMFAVYAAGMMLPLLAVSVALALGRDVAVRKIRAFTRYANRISGGLLIVAGGYVILFWSVTLSAPDRDTIGIVQVVDSLSARLTNALGGRPLLSGAALVALLVSAGLYVLVSRRRRTARDDEQDPGERDATPVGGAPG